MPEIYFNIPFFRRLTSADAWEKENQLGTRYHVDRAFFRLNVHQLPGPARIGRKVDVTGHDIPGITTGIKKRKVVETEVFQQADTIERSIVESECMLKVLTELTAKFGNGKIFNFGGTVKPELSSKIKSSFSKEFKITNSYRKRKQIEYEFTNTLPADFTDRVCGVEVYQRCNAVLYLIQVDFLNVSYERTMLGLRKKLRKHPFPENASGKHPNIIKIGAAVATLEFWQLLSESSLIIKDADYRPEVIDEADITVMVPDATLKDRPYWNVPKYPTLYQLSNVAFPYKWINKKNSEYSREELMEMELGEAEGSAWWFTHGPGRLKNAYRDRTPHH